MIEAWDSSFLESSVILVLFEHDENFLVDSFLSLLWEQFDSSNDDTLVSSLSCSSVDSIVLSLMKKGDLNLGSVLSSGIIPWCLRFSEIDERSFWDYERSLFSIEERHLMKRAAIFRGSKSRMVSIRVIASEYWVIMR